jgi:hypothetical protein
LTVFIQAGRVPEVAPVHLASELFTFLHTSDTDIVMKTDFCERLGLCVGAERMASTLVYDAAEHAAELPNQPQATQSGLLIPDKDSFPKTLSASVCVKVRVLCYRHRTGSAPEPVIGA